MMFRLAAKLGWSVAMIEHGMDHTEFLEWCEFYALEPFGEIRDDLRAGMVCSTVVNSQLSKKDRSKARKPGDFVMFDALKKKEPEQSPDAQILALLGPRAIRKTE